MEASQHRDRQEGDRDREPMGGSASGCSATVIPNRSGRELDHHEDPEEAERRALAEVDELDDAAQEEPGERQEREGDEEPRAHGEGAYGPV